MAYSDRFPIVKNFFETQLVVACDAGATELHLADVGGLPAVLVGRDYIPLVVRKATGSREIVYVESVDAGSGTVRVQRGQEGTLATSWDVGAYVYCTVTAESFQRMRVNGFAPLVDPDGGRPAITRTSATAISITGDFSSQIEVGMAIRVLSGNAVVAPTDATLGAIFVGSVSYSGGKTLVGLQNVSLPSTVSGLDLGLSVASAPLYHPDTPLGDGETITMEGGLLKITDKFKQSQATRDAQQDEAISAAQTAANNAVNGALVSAVIDGLDLVLTYGNGTTKRVPLPTGKGVGDMWFGVDPKSKPASVQAYSGQLLSRSAYPSHWAFVNGGNRTVISESQWQAQVSANGFCPYYSSGDGSTTYRMPSLKGVHPKFVAALAEAGGYTAAGLPNITGSISVNNSGAFSTGTQQSNNFTMTGVFGGSALGGTAHNGGISNYSTALRAINLDASRSNSIYGASTTVQPPAVNIILGEYVVGAVAPLGEANATSLLASVTRLESGVGALENGVGRAKTYITETWKDGNGNWYRKWSDGWIEQGGKSMKAEWATITLPTAFSDTNYTVVCGGGKATSLFWNSCNIISTTQINVAASGSMNFMTPAWYYACGY